MMQFNYEQQSAGRWHEYVDTFSWKPAKYKTLGELIEAEFSDFEISSLYKEEHFPLEGDISHGYEIEIFDNTKHGYGVSVYIHPFIEWSDGMYKPCRYWGSKYAIALEKK